MIEVFKFLWISLIVETLLSCTPGIDITPINREALVQRHIVVVDAFDSLASLTAGNGGFAFTVDFTGLQTFPELYEKGIPLGTQSDWGWHSFPNPARYEHKESLKDYDFHGRQISYDVQWTETGRRQDAANYFRRNPHRLHLGVIGLDLLQADGSAFKIEEIDSICQTLDPWSGEIHSYFNVKGTPVKVTTCVHQQMDIIAAEITSPLIEKGLLRIRLRFPYPSGQHSDSGCDWDKPGNHRSVMQPVTAKSAIIQRLIDSSHYDVHLAWSEPADLTENAAHDFLLVPGQGNRSFSFSCLFAPANKVKELPGFKTTLENSRAGWKSYWMSGGAIDFSGSTDPRAFELERRVVLSQYLTRIQCAGSYPPQETGLTYNSWYGKFHLEMHWWHAVHFALWNRMDLLEKSLGWYGTIAERAAETAKRQGFNGVRWPKMTDPLGFNSPSGVGSFLIWQQPHIIYFAEMCHRNNAKKEVLKKYADLVFSTADFMASYAWHDSINDRFVLGPALIPAQERFSPVTTINPPFELSYWYWGLSTAQLWRERLGLQRNRDWDEVLNKLSALPGQNGLYMAAESAPDSYTNPRYMTDHPMVLGAFGMLPAYPLMDTVTMKRTFDYVWENWHWDDTWGWDFPMVAMSATRLGMPDKALDALFMDVETNTWLPNGHNYQDERLRLYLPGNGALLTAVAMMCAGYDGSNKDAPGFPKDGTWKVKWEGLAKLP